MTILTDDLVESVIVNGEEYKVDMSFDNILRLYDMLNDKTLTDGEQIVLGIQMLFDRQFDLPPHEIVKVWEETFTALLGKGEEAFEYDIKGNLLRKKGDDESEQTFCFTQDANYIYASFMSDYGIDLNDERGKMHWYKFKSLLDGLRDDTRIKKVIEIRTMEIPPKTKGKDRERIEKLKKQYALKPKGGV